MPSFDDRVWRLLERIPRGKVSTYKQVAVALGKPNAARAVGNACRKNPFAPRVPCHRVVKSNGFVGGYAHGVQKKIALLKSEGIETKNGRIVDFKNCLFKP